MHFWVGSFCGILDDGGSKPTFTRGAIAGADIIGLIENIGNQIPDIDLDKASQLREA